MTAVHEGLISDAAARVGDVATLRASRCDDCGRTEFPARTSCPACAGRTVQIQLGPAARLQGFTAVLHSPPGADVDVPYTIAVAAFPENIAVLGLLDRHVSDSELSVGDSLEVCVVATRTKFTYGFRLG